MIYLICSPIGNLNDLSLRALHILKNVSLIACEDTRQTKKIMSKFEFKNHLISFNAHNSEIKIPKIIAIDDSSEVDKLFIIKFYLKILFVGLSKVQVNYLRILQHLDHLNFVNFFDR